MSKILGIDLGTTFSCASYIDEHGQPEIVLNGEGQPITASAVWIDEDDNMIVGQLARDNSIAFPEDVIVMAKRSMGSHDLKLKARDKELTPQEVSAIILKKMKQDAERVLGEDVTDAVITCPAFFGASETQATQEAGEMAGFNVRRIFPEPAAAALAFGYDNPDQEKTLLVYDLGGGTFDITLFKVGKPEDGSSIPKITMISTEGDRQLGGADWDQHIVDYVAEDFIQKCGKTLIENALSEKCGSEEAIRQALDELDQVPSTPFAVVTELAQAGLDEACVRKALEDVAIDPRSDVGAHQDLHQRAERAKIALSRVAKTYVVCQHAGLSHRVELTREQLIELTEHLLERTVTATEELLAAKGYRPEDIDEVLCAGGSTRMPSVRDKLQEMFPGRVNTRLEPDLCVARGAARMAQLLESGTASDDVGGISLTPHSYGVCARDMAGRELIYPVILKDQGLPVRSARATETERLDYQHGIFHIASLGQTRVVIEVYENNLHSYEETEQPEASRKIGSVVIDDLPPNRPPGQQVYVTFHMDRSLQLRVEALDVSSGKEQTGLLSIQSDVTAEGLLKATKRKAEMTRILQDAEVRS